ncbi:unnamed protein product, partial [marine sediment metagenome]
EFALGLISQSGMIKLAKINFVNLTARNSES